MEEAAQDTKEEEEEPVAGEGHVNLRGDWRCFSGVIGG